MCNYPQISETEAATMTRTLQDYLKWLKMTPFQRNQEVLLARARLMYAGQMGPDD